MEMTEVREQRDHGGSPSLGALSVELESSGSPSRRPASSGAASGLAEELAAAAPASRVPTSAIFALFVVIELLVNYDSGAVPALLDIISQEFRIGKFEQGMLGGLPYLGLVVASPMVGHFLVGNDMLSAKTLVFATLLLNTGCSLIIALTGSAEGLYAARLGTGLTQATFVIYAPVWVDEFAPRSHMTMWMAIIQASVALGVMVGYGAGAVFAGEGWRRAFVIQVSSLGMASLAFGSCKGSWINRPETSSQRSAPESRVSTLRFSFASGNSGDSSPPGTSAPAPNAGSAWGRLKLLARNRVFAPLVFALCGLFFVVTGIQFWSTDYLNNAYSLARMHVEHVQGEDTHPGLVGRYIRRPFQSFNHGMVFVHESDTHVMFYEKGVWKIVATEHARHVDLPLPETADIPVIQAAGSWVCPDTAEWPAQYRVSPILDRNLIYLCFSVVAATGPTVGVLVGGRIIDAQGGYHGQQNMVNALGTCTIFGALATAVGIMVSVVDMFWPIVIGLWTVLFWGGCILPPATGMLLAVVDSGLRPFASATSMVFYNVFGYALGCIVPGAVTDWVKYAIKDRDTVVDPRYIDVWGMRLILWWSVVGFLGMLLAWRSAQKDLDAMEGNS